MSSSTERSSKPSRTQPWRRRFLGEMLVAHGIISSEQLDEVLKLQRSNKGARIGRLLVDMGHVTETQLAELIADQLRIEAVDLRTLTFDPDVLKRLPKELATRHLCVPWQIQGRQLALVMADPTNVAAIDAIGFAVGLSIQPVVAPESDVVAAVARFYDAPEAETAFLDLAHVDLADQLSVVDDGDAADPEGLDEAAKGAQAGPVIKLVNGILADAITNEASDIHIEPQERGVALRYRVDGALRHVLTIPKRAQAKIVSRIKIMAHMDIAERRKPQDGRARLLLDGRTYDLRVSTLPTADGEKLCIRILVQDRAQVALEELGFEPDTLALFVNLIKRPQGLILVTGPTGSGKTTTLYAALNCLRSETTNVVTIEDPVEYRLPGINQVAVHEKAGLTFAAGLRSILRQDPDVVMVGEIRDTETAKIAFQAAQTGHLVLSTLHTNDTASAVTRLIDMGVPAYLVASSVVGVLAQRLTRRLCDCAASTPHGLQPKGCAGCHRTGYRGRVAVYELLKVTPEVRAAVLKGGSEDDIRLAARAGGMRTMFEDGALKVGAGTTTLDELVRLVPPPDDGQVTEAAASPVPVAFAPPAPTASVRATMPARPRVIIADTDRDLADAVKHALEMHGIDAVTVRNPQELQAAVQRDVPHLVVTDLFPQMGTEGLDLIRRWRSSAATQHIYIVAMSVRLNPRLEVRAFEAGADDILGKPVDAEALLTRIRRILLRLWNHPAAA